MPTDSCQFFYECTNCGKILKPKVDDCCVYCSYGSVNVPGSMAIAIGSLVDDAIIYVENIYKQLRKNVVLPPEEKNPLLPWFTGHLLK